MVFFGNWGEDALFYGDTLFSVYGEIIRPEDGLPTIDDESKSRSNCH
jgi:hypothetical protein